MTRVLLASTNAGKLKELQALAPDGYELILAPEALEVEETGATFAENARLKARAYATAFGEPALADDSGLAVDALDGRPGVHSARYAPGSDADRITKLLGELASVPEAGRTAAFVCAMALVFPDGRVFQAEGRCEGVITTAPRGTGGFGYDPVFLVPALGRTFAEIDKAEKNAISHRANAMKQLRERLPST